MTPITAPILTALREQWSARLRRPDPILQRSPAYKDAQKKVEPRVPAAPTL